jgi:hypothetical protein
MSFTLLPDPTDPEIEFKRVHDELAEADARVDKALADRAVISRRFAMLALERRERLLHKNSSVGAASA